MCAAERGYGGCREEVVFGQGLHQSRLVVLGLFVQVTLSSLQKPGFDWERVVGERRRMYALRMTMNTEH